MNEVKTAQAKKHSVSLDNRKKMVLEGVSDVISFDEGGAMLETTCGRMAIEGEDMHVTVLNITDGKVEIDGKINGVYYIDNKPAAKRGLFGKRVD